MSKRKVELEILPIWKRYQRGWTQKELAFLAGVSQSTISRRLRAWEEERSIFMSIYCSIYCFLLEVGIV